MKTHPLPGMSRTLKVPASASMLWRAIERPRPRPDLSSLRCVNGVNILSALPGGSPPHWSFDLDEHEVPERVRAQGRPRCGRA